MERWPLWNRETTGTRLPSCWRCGDGPDEGVGKVGHDRWLTHPMPTMAEPRTSASAG